MQTYEHEDYANAVAIVGLACEFPGAIDYQSFWDLLRDGRETITHFTTEQLLQAGVKPERLKLPNYIRSKGVVTCAEYFDHELFGIEADRAMLMDPQHRVFMQKCWETLEDAGCDPHRFKGPIGLFAGSALNTYVLNNLRHADRSLTRKFSSIEFLLMTDKDFLTTQTSHYLGLTGPSVTIQTACSTSLVAVHYACQSLLSYESDLALAGAVTIYAPQVKGYLYEPDSIISPDGHVHSFDARGGGTVYSSGVGVVALKRLHDALRDNDQIYSVIRATAINNDGARKATFNMPSVDGIAEVAAHALALAAVPADSIAMVEANGSGTAFGDPIEIEALTRAYGEYGVKSALVGAVKSNIGHMNVTAGMGALLKAVASLQHAAIPPSINYEKPNPRIAFDKTPFEVATSLSSWPNNGYPRRCGVNVYGVGGTNAHAILEQAPDVVRNSSSHHSHLLLLSGASEDALLQHRARLEKYMIAHGDLDLGDVAVTLSQGRKQLNYRCAAVVHGSQVIEASLPQIWPLRGQAQAGKRPVAMVFGCQPDPSFTDLRQAFEHNPVFATAYHEVLDAAPELGALMAESLADSSISISMEPTASLRAFALSYALAQNVLACGLLPDCLAVGVSPLAAAAVAGVLSVAQACEVLRILGMSPSSRVAAVGDYLRPLTLAPAAMPVVDARNVQVASGSEAIVESWAELFAADGTSLAPSIPEHHLAMVLGNLADNDNAAHVTFAADQDFNAHCLATVGALWVRGGTCDLTRYYRDSPRFRVSLPTYPFARTRHWVDIPVDTKPSNYDVAL